MLSRTYGILKQVRFRPRGYINFLSDGRMIVLVMKSDRPAPRGAGGGTYVADAEKVVHSIDWSWNQGWTGTQRDSSPSNSRAKKRGGDRVRLGRVQILLSPKRQSSSALSRTAPSYMFGGERHVSV
jgi:hypothetical protein